MRRALLGVLLMLSLSLAGCLAPSSAGWGDGGVSVSTDGMNATVVSDLTPSQTTVDEVMLAGCDTEGMIGDAANQTGLITIEGHLAASTLYTSHGEDMRGLASGVTAAVILEAMSYGSAEAVPNGQGARIPVRDWTEPLNPSTGSGQSTSQRTVNVEDVDSDSNEPWFVLGLIPGSEHVAYGFGAVDDVHQPIRIEGYMVVSVDGTRTAPGLTSGARSQSGSPCLLDVDSSNKGTYYVIVHSITLPGASVTMDGDADDEWVMGDVPLLGRGGYVVYFLRWPLAVGRASTSSPHSASKASPPRKPRSCSARRTWRKQRRRARRRSERRRNLRVPRPSRRKRRSRRRRMTPALAVSIWMRPCPPKGPPPHRSLSARRAAARASWSRKKPRAWPRKPRPPPLPRPRRQARLGRRRCPPQNDAAAG